MTKQAKIIVLLLISGTVFASGYKVSDWRNDAQLLKQQQDFATALEAQRSEAFAEFEQQRSVDEAERVALQTDLDAVRNLNAQLQEDLTNATLIEPAVEIRWRERVVAGECSAETLRDFNPFGAEFVRLWNDAANSGADVPRGTNQDETSGGYVPVTSYDDGPPRQPDRVAARGRIEGAIASAHGGRTALQYAPSEARGALYVDRRRV